jgi:uncharacterized membrane protein YtjA (UPF0391 family)
MRGAGGLKGKPTKEQFQRCPRDKLRSCFFGTSSALHYLPHYAARFGWTDFFSVYTRRTNRHVPEFSMIYWSATFFLIAIVAGVFGFGNISAGAVDIAKVLFFLFIVLFIVSTVLSLIRRGGRDI